MTTSILVLDDDKSLRYLINSFFEAKGWQVFEAGEIETARRITETDQIDVAIVDGLLPDGNGIDFIEELHSRHPKKKTVFLSAFLCDNATVKKLTDELGVSRVFRKPIQIPYLLQEIEHLIGEEGTGSSAENPDTQVGTDVDREEGLKKIASLKATYAEKLQRTLDKLLLMFASMPSYDTPKEAIRSALKLAHSVNGTSGTYGFCEVSTGAAFVEQLLVDVLDGKRIPDSFLWNRARAALERGNRSLVELGGRLSVADGVVSGQQIWTSTILVVDQDDDFLQDLVQLGHTNLIFLVPARSEHEALCRATEHHLDGAMISISADPDENAFCLAHKLQEHHANRQLPVGFLIPNGDPLYRVAAVHAGASLILNKPLSPDQFVDEVRTLGSPSRALTTKVLFFSDGTKRCQDLQRALEIEGIDTRQNDTPMMFAEVLSREQPDAIVADIVMPGLSGFDVCRMVRATPDWRDIPVLLVANQQTEGIIGRAFEAGADDCLTCETDKANIAARVRSRLNRARAVQERNQRDPITGLPNRGPFTRAFNACIAENQRRREPMSLALIDIDQLKGINDRHGHLAGDQVLACLGRFLSSRFRSSDLRSRWGGDEFALAVVGEHSTTAARLLGNMLDEFRRHEFKDTQGHPFRATFSAGVASSPEDGHTLASLLERSDGRLYQAKAEGRNRVF